MSMTPEEEDGYSLEEKFDAAVKVIWTLPEDGPFQPSDDMMLMFYSYYKQATLGPCNIPRPTGFWDTRGKAKWDAWSALGNMTREEAMMKYVEDIQLILETIPISSEVTELVQKLGNFFTEVESNNEDAEENEVDKRPFTRPFAKHTDEQAMKPTIQGFGDFWDDIQNLPETEKDDIVVDQSVDSEDSKSLRLNCECKNCEDEENDGKCISHGEYMEEEEMEKKGCNPDQILLMVENKRWRSSIQGSNCSSMEPSVSSFTNGTHSSLNSEVEEEELACSLEPAIQYNPYIHFSEQLIDCNVPAGINVRSTDSDNEEFCDSMEHLAIDQVHESRLFSKRQNDPRLNGFPALYSENQHGLIDRTSMSDFKSAMSKTGTEIFGPTCGSRSGQNVNVACCCVSQSTQSLCNSRENMNEQIASALLRLQHDMDNVLHKLQTLEVLQTSQPQSPSLDQHPLAAALQFIKPSWWPSQSSPFTVFFTVIWPVFAHWLVLLYLQRRR
ncbi:acyl-CoA-binding domain-containing protein 5A-like [Periophthalmus magnuspinnatus]|uniref:acyl-CoA-binding domain-containing protein 5A-like n=1 Tax=Periophthalmus magnuspinnatus TaxID=409849 RepID=UPI0024363CA5|nr:acyl-CoA-binding domain-containing protein 5A-like [Periophthalmus magnuspinnatus]